MPALLGVFILLDHHSSETLTTGNLFYRRLPQQAQTSCFSLHQPLGRICLTKHEDISGCLLGNDQAAVAKVFHWHRLSPWKADDSPDMVRSCLPMLGLSIRCTSRDGFEQFFHVLPISFCESLKRL